MLRSLGIQNFDCVVVAIAGSIEDSVLTTITLKEKEAKNKRHTKILTQLGADKVIHPEFDIGIVTGYGLLWSMMMQTTKPDMEISATISIGSIVIACVLIFAFTLFVNYLLGRKFKGIDMVTSLKSVERTYKSNVGEAVLRL